MIPMYGFFIWAYNCPEDCILIGRRWMFKGEPEISSNVIRYIKFASIFAMVGSPIVLISIFLKPYVFGLALIVFILVLITGATLILTAESKD